ncbi:hypothetical protein SISSUDRAFT_1116836 [Sistotremastrum suecicum HHB10207 ss-3]|uniref:GST N-terminal domain-containing protein n=1 Tax=Sistotremastrum suecicum HHB10207 ss-3 TaxID=1314776 RepID=A0A166HCB2_9AGAM|nr:hypothetical protein SISSUDRAFT_1116836 [Sistotremastrum suecicum HHB10207 ss-3]
MSTPVIYTFGGSVWAAAPALAIGELDYPEGAIKETEVNLGAYTFVTIRNICANRSTSSSVNGANFDPKFVKINPNATLPTLVDGEHVYTNTKDVVDYLIKHAPTPLPSSDPKIIDLVHEDSVDPNFALLLSRNEEELSAKGQSVPGMFLKNRQEALEKYAPTAPPELKSFYDAKLAGNGALNSFYAGTASDDAKAAFFTQSQGHWASLKEFILKTLPGYLPSSGFIAGEKPGEADFHVGAWIARIGAVVGGSPDSKGVLALEKELGEPVPARVQAYWAAWSERESWKQLYKDGLH